MDAGKKIQQWIVTEWKEGVKMKTVEKWEKWKIKAPKIGNSNADLKRRGIILICCDNNLNVQGSYLYRYDNKFIPW